MSVPLLAPTAFYCLACKTPSVRMTGSTADAPWTDLELDCLLCGQKSTLRINVLECDWFEFADTCDRWLAENTGGVA